MTALTAVVGSMASAADTSTQVLDVFKRHCAECHGSNSIAPKKFQFVDDLTRLRTSKYVRREDPENSDLYQQVLTQEMPLRTKAEKEAGKDAEPLKPEEVALILSWIKAGAPEGQGTSVVAESTGRKTPPAGQGGITLRLDVAELRSTNSSVKSPPVSVAHRKLVTENELLTEALTDLLKQAAEDRNDIRFVSIAPQHNNVSDVKDEQLEVMRAGVRKLLNSLSINPKIAKFAEVGPEKVLFRVKLSDLGWDTEMWDHVAGFYPYALEGAGLTGLGSACHATVPILRADWLATNATRPPLYHDILRIPATTQELEHKLGIDLNRDLAEGRAIRSGFTKSGVSLANRMIERVETGAYAGDYWKSYDFKQNAGRGRVHDFPLGPIDAKLAGGNHAFEHAGGEIVFSLPNGLHGYMLTNAAGARLDGVAPTNIVGDQTGVTGRVEVSNGLSCITCHDRGIKTPVPPDEVRAVAGSSTFSAEEQRLIERLHPEQKKIEAWLKADEARFMTALKEAGAEQKPGRESVYTLAELFERPVTLAQAASELGLEVKDFDDRTKTSSALFDIHTQLAGAGIPRDTFATKFNELALRLNLGSVRTAELLLVTSQPLQDKPRAVPISVTLRTNKALFRNQEKLTAYVQAAQDCELRLLYKDAAGKIILLFPNKFHPDSHIAGGKEIAIPAAADKFDIIIEAPFGVESLAAIVSTQVFADEAKIQAALRNASDPEKVFVDFNEKDFEVAVVKSARLRARDARLGVARVNLTTHP
ncbi:MAG: DUF4384 domain-containing protein [Verrucomicrobia bacterium]|nr:DUF4384 domain-containing protein [Verrucomicrobiota bacterium]